MLSKFAKTLIALLLVSPVLAGDLYLLKIDGYPELNNARRFVDHAHGLIDGKFIVDLTDNQRQSLRRVGLSPLLVARDFDSERYFLVARGDEEYVTTPVDFDAVYSGRNRYIVSLGFGDDQVLARAGYQVIPMTDYLTPLFYRPPMIPGLMPDNYPSDTLADLISQDSLYSYDTRMVAFQTRFLDSDSSDAVRDWLIDKFQEFGYIDVEYDNFYVTSESYGVYNRLCHNVICTSPGNEIPDRYILIGAHFDSYNHDADTRIYAPGADDNASGVACVLELARILASFDNRKTFLFTPFGAEELGLFGSGHLAQTLYQGDVDLELAINLDMVGYLEDDTLDTEVESNNAFSYVSALRAATVRVTDLIPIDGESGSDHASFYDFGFSAAFFQEGDFNYDGWHTNLDIPSRMDFTYLEKVARALAASVATIDRAADPISFAVYDIGDGQSLRVAWDSSSTGFHCRLYCSTSPFVYGDTITVTPDIYSYDLTGLNEGADYYIGVQVIPDSGIPQIGVPLITASTLSVPRTPAGVTAEPDTGLIIVEWQANAELDLSHYRLFRMPVGATWETINDYYTDTVYHDFSVVGHQEYMYKVVAVDFDGYVSDTSAVAVAVPATLDGGILLVDETQPGGDMPGETAQNLFYGAIIDTFAYDILKIDDDSDFLTRSQAGQYNPIFWVDDDNQLHLWELSLDSLAWYFSYHTDFLLAGWETITHITGQTYFYEGDLFHDELGLSYVGKNSLPDFIGAFGQGDWPDLELKPEAPNNARLDNIQIFLEVPEAEVIYRFDSYSGNPFYNNKPVGIAYDSYDGKRVVLGCPLFWLTEESAGAFIDRVMEYFAAPSVYVNGDVNDDRVVNLLDVTHLIAYLYQGGPPPVRINHGDPNADCTINILDIIYLINYLYNAGSAPLAGCVEPN